MFNKNIFVAVLFLATLILLCNNSSAQEKKKPEVRISPKAEVSQKVGFTEISISYSRPGVKGRKIWGGLVPYNKVWRAGANEATAITFSTDVKINGKKLKKGSYGFFTIPTEKEWTLIFNNIWDQWGAFTYNEAKDELRIKVKSVKNIFTEWLNYSFDKMNVQKAGKTNSAVICLNWENIKVPFTVEVETKE